MTFTYEKVTFYSQERYEYWYKLSYYDKSYSIYRIRDSSDKVVGSFLKLGNARRVFRPIGRRQ